MFRISAYADAHQGLVREYMEDDYAMENLKDGSGFPFVVVADGMGGHEGGDVASQLATSTIMRTMNTSNERSLGTRIRTAFRAANTAIAREAKKRRFRAMGTTAVCAVVREEEDGLGCVIGNVGDSRAYVIRDGEIVGKTRDHSLVQELVDAGRISEEEAEDHPRANIVTLALDGKSDMSKADIYRVSELEKGDIIVLCTDGLTKMVTDKRIAKIASGRDAASLIVQKLIKEALKNGGHDNVTVAVLQIR